MKPRIVVLVALAAVAAMLGAPTLAVAKQKFKAELDGFQETPLTLSTTGTGEFRAQVNNDETIEYELTYSDIQFGSVLFAHIHLGRPGITGGVIAFLCGGGGKPACPGPTAGTVTGTITAADVIGPAGQGIAPGQFAELLTALDEGATYVNVHSTGFPGGEIRGAVK